MKILYDCFSCSPYYGSDEGIGWLWPSMMSKYHEIWVLVRKDRQQDIEKYCGKNQINNIHFVYCDIPNWMNLYYRNLKQNKNGIMDFLIYQYLWQFPAYMKAKKLHKRVRFDLVHHVCTNDFRILGYMYKLKIPYIIGPIGGAQETPIGLKYYVRNHKKSEKMRSMLNQVMVRLLGYKKALNSANKIYFSNQETKDFLAPYIQDSSKCELLTEIGFVEENCVEKVTKKDETETIFMWAGRMEYRKGLELLVDVIKTLPLDKKWKVIFCGDGREKKYIENLCAQYKLEKRVEFLGKVPYEKMEMIYKKADVFVFPSLRETTGTVIIEAMAHSLPVICLKQGGAVEIINENMGFLIPVEDKDECINAFGMAMEKCINFPENTRKIGENARIHIMNNYLWEQKISNMERVYRKLVEQETYK